MNLSNIVPTRLLFTTAWLVAATTSCSSDRDQGAGEADPSGPQILVPGAAGGSGTSPGTSGRGTGRNQGGTGFGGPVSVGEPTREEYCAGSGPPVGVQTGSSAQSSGGACSTGIASRVFQYGLCSCRDASFTGSFYIDAFDSTKGAYQPGQTGADVGINGRLITTGTIEIFGSLIAAGSGLLTITSSLFHIDGNFETNADLMITGANILFGRDLWVNGEATAIGFAEVEGDVYQSPGHGPPAGIVIGGQVHSQDFVVAEPCACAEEDILDIDAIVATGLENSHNAEVGLGEDGLTHVGVNMLDLECGRFAFPSGNIVGATVLKVDGRTALFIDGDLTITGSFAVDVGASGELDVFVTGNLILTGAGQVGSQDRPAAVRFYVGGSGDIAITGANQFAANLYAPRANVTVSGADDIYGALFVGSYTAIGAQVMHYDAAVLRSGGDGGSCDDPPECSDDSNCPAPTLCQRGRCRPLSDGPD